MLCIMLCMLYLRCVLCYMYVVYSVKCCVVLCMYCIRLCLCYVIFALCTTTTYSCVYIYEYLRFVTFVLCIMLDMCDAHCYNINYASWQVVNQLVCF